jgi:hypothetical protein
VKLARRTLDVPIRAIAAAVLALAIPAAFVTFVLLPARTLLVDRSSELERQLERTARLQGIAELGRQAIDGARTEDSSKLIADFLTGNQDSIIVAELQSRLRALALASNVELNSANALPARTLDGLTYLGLRAVLRGQLEDIQRVLHSTEAGTPLLFVQRANLRVDTWPIKSADPSLDGAPAIVAELDIYGAKLPLGLTSAAEAATSTSVMPAVPLALAPGSFGVRNVAPGVLLPPVPLTPPAESLGAGGAATRGGRRP